MVSQPFLQSAHDSPTKLSRSYSVLNSSKLIVSGLGPCPPSSSSSIQQGVSLVAPACSLGQPMSAGSSACPARLLKIFGKLESSWTAAHSPQRAFMFGEFLSRWDVWLISPDSRPPNKCLALLRASKSRAPSKFSGMREAHEFSCPGGIPIPPSVVVSGRTAAHQAVSSLSQPVPCNDHHSLLSLPVSMVSVLLSYV